MTDPEKLDAIRRYINSLTCPYTDHPKHVKDSNCCMVLASNYIGTDCEKHHMGNEILSIIEERTI